MVYGANFLGGEKVMASIGVENWLGLDETSQNESQMSLFLRLVRIASRAGSVQLASRANNVEYTIIPYYYYVLNYFNEILEFNT
jgi:hypothetical protein